MHEPGPMTESRRSAHERRTNNIKKGSLFKALEATTQKAAKTKIRVTRAEKECHITIKDFTLSHVCKAMKAIIRFQEVEGTVVNMAKVLSTHCSKHLKLKYSGLMLIVVQYLDSVILFIISF